jgi:hypothetical protein
MKTKMNIAELAEALRTQAAQKYDVIVNAARLHYYQGKLRIDDLKADGISELLKDVGGIKFDKEQLPAYMPTFEFNTTQIFEDQICAKLNIPRDYFRRMSDSEKNTILLDHNVNHWLSQSNENFLVRTFLNKEDPSMNTARAMLSSSFKMIDNFDILMTALDAVRETGIELKIDSCDLTEKKMYVRFIAPSVEIQAPELLKNYHLPSAPQTGEHGIVAGFVLTNSETGHGAFTITPRLIVKVCNNGMIAKKDSLRKIHVGAKQEEAEIKWSEETNQKQLELVQLQIRDAVRTFITPEYVSRAADFILSANKTLDLPIDTVKNVTKELQYDIDKSESILNFFLKSGDFTSFGVAQAVTLYAGKEASPDDQYDLESAAFEVVELATANDKPFEQKRKSNKGFSNN